MEAARNVSDPSAPTQSKGTWRRVWGTAVGALLLIALPAGVYLGGAAAAGRIDGQSVERAVAFQPDVTPSASPPRQIAAAAMTAGAVGMLFLSPALLAMLAARRVSALRGTAHVWSLILNSVALFLVLAVLRYTVGVGRLELLTAWLAWAVLLFAAAWEPGRTPAVLVELARRWRGPLLVGASFVAVAIVVLFPEQFVQCFNEDGTETYELARSLRERLLPAWEFEVADPEAPARFGTVVVNPSLVNSTWTCALQTLIGDGELATRLPYWMWWFALLLVCCRLAQPDSTNRAAEAPVELTLRSVPIGLMMCLVAVLFTFYVGYNPYMADLANPGVPNAIFALLVLASFECLRARDRWGFVLSMALASLVLYAGPVMLVLTLAAAWVWRAIPRGTVWQWAISAAGVLTAVALGYLVRGASEEVLSLWVGTFDLEYVNDYLAAVPRWKSAALFFGYFVLGAGGIVVWGMFAALRRGGWQRTVATAAWCYLLIVLLSGYKNLHYLGPLLPIPLVLLLNSAQGRRLRMWSAAASVSIVVCIALSWPAQRTTFTLNRDLGVQTTFATDSYETAAQWSRLQQAMRARNVISWDCDRHTWVAYSELNANTENSRPFLVMTGRPPFGYQPIVARQVEGSAAIAVLFARDPEPVQWMRSQQPLRPLQRYPLLFRPLADGLYSPHNNWLEDVRRLRL